MTRTVLVGLLIAIAAGCTAKVAGPQAVLLHSPSAQSAIARLQPGRMTKTDVERLLGAPAKLEKGAAEGLYVATYYLSLSTNYPGVIANGRCLMTVHYSGQWAGLMFDRIAGPHYPDN